MSKLQSRLAVLIDADNSQPSIIEGLMDEIAQFGVASVKRIYGDWTTTQLTGWKSTLLNHGMHPMQQFAYTTGKNATDSAMIIDAMDLLYSEKLDGFCIVSSDSDFTRLASRMRESGKMVYGFGERKTPRAFVAACDKFIYTENLRAEVVSKQPSASKKRVKCTSFDKAVLELLKNAVEDTADYSGWSFLGAIGQNIANKAPDFDPRNYGCKKLGELMEKTGLFETKANDPLSPSLAIYMRLKRQKA